MVSPLCQEPTQGTRARVRFLIPTTKGAEAQAGVPLGAGGRRGAGVGAPASAPEWDRRFPWSCGVWFTKPLTSVPPQASYRERRGTGAIRMWVRVAPRSPGTPAATCGSPASSTSSPLPVVFASCSCHSKVPQNGRLKTTQIRRLAVWPENQDQGGSRAMLQGLWGEPFPTRPRSRWLPGLLGSWPRTPGLRVCLHEATFSPLCLRGHTFLSSLS